MDSRNASGIKNGGEELESFDASVSDGRGVCFLNKAQRRAYCKKRARDTLLCRNTGNLLTFDLAALILMLVTVAVEYITESFFSLFETFALGTSAAKMSETLTGVETVAESMIMFALVLPVLSGCLALARGMLDYYAQCGGIADLGGKRAVLGDVFSAFSSGAEYFRCLRVAFCYIWRWGLFCVAFVAGVYCSRLTFYYLLTGFGYGAALLATLGVTAGVVVLAAFGVILLMRWFPTLSISRRRPDLRPSDTARLASRVMRGNKCDCVKLILSFLRWFLLSELTL